MHALQALPFLALLLMVLAGVAPILRDVERRAHLLRVAGLAWSGLFAITLWQALRGQALLRPDLLTVAALTGLAGLVAGMAIAHLIGRLRHFEEQQ